MKQTKLIPVIFICVIGACIIFSSSLCFASVADLQSQLASIQSQISSINAQIAQLRSQLAQLNGENDDEGDHKDYEGSDDNGKGKGDQGEDPDDSGQGEGEDEGYYDDDDIYYDDDGNPYTSDEIDQMIDDGVFDEGGLPDWAMGLDERERSDFPDDPSQMTGGGVYTNRGIGDGQKITDWDSDPTATDINERTRDDSDYGSTEGEEGKHSDKDDWSGGSWKDEDHSGSGEQSFSSPGGRSPGSKAHSHDANGRDASSGGGGMFGFLGNMLAEPLVKTAEVTADAVTSPFQDGENVSRSSSTTGEDRSPSNDVDMDPDVLEGLQRYGEALNLGMGAGNSGAGAHQPTADTHVNDQFTITPMSPEDAALYGGALLPDTNRGNMSSTASGGANYGSQSSSTNTSPTKTSRASGTKSRTGWSQPSRVEAGTTSTDPHILPGNQNVMSGSRSSMGGGKDIMRGGKDVMHSGAGAYSAQHAADTLALNTNSIRGAKNSLIKVQRALEDALHNGDISITQYDRAMQGITQSRTYLDVMRSSAGSISQDEVKAMSADISTQITNIRGMIDVSDSNVASALDTYESAVHQAIDVGQVEERAAAQNVEGKPFIEGKPLIEAREVLPVEGKPFIEGKPMITALQKEDVYVRPISEAYEGKLIEGKPLEALQRHDVYVRPVTEQHLEEMVEVKPIQQQEQRLIEVRPVMERTEKEIVATDQLEPLYPGELTRETFQEEEEQEGFWNRFFGNAKEDKEEETKYIK